MIYEYIGPQLEMQPSRPAPGPNREPSPKVVEKLREILPLIEEIKSGETVSPVTTDTEL